MAIFRIDGTFRTGVSTNRDTGDTQSLVGLAGSAKIYDGATDASVVGSDIGEAMIYDLKLGGVQALRFINGVAFFDMRGGNDLYDALPRPGNPRYTADVVVDGGTGNDTIWSGDGDDFLRGGTGADQIYSGEDSGYFAASNDLSTFEFDTRDFLEGGSGADVFVACYRDAGAVSSGCDAISDFEVGIDKIKLTGVLTQANAELVDTGDASTLIAFRDGGGNVLQDIVLYLEGVDFSSISDPGMLFL